MDIYAEAGEVCRFTDCSDDGWVSFALPFARACLNRIQSEFRTSPDPGRLRKKLKWAMK